MISNLGRFWRSKVRRFGMYEKVLPVETTPSRVVPDHIERPEYARDDPTLTTVKYPEIKNIDKINSMKKSCQLAAKILSQVETFVKPGITTDEIDEFVHNLSIEAGAYPSPLEYKGFPKSVCTSVNNVAAHGIPDLRPLQDGDIINVDITVYFKGFHGDCSKTFEVGNVDEKGKELIYLTEKALEVGIMACGPDVPFNEIGSRISRFARRNKLNVLPTFAGHGIGEYFHGPPDIFHVSNRYPGLMKPGMTFTIEPCLSHGTERVYMLDDGWTIITEDNARAAQAEHTVLITSNGCEILT